MSLSFGLLQCVIYSHLHVTLNSFYTDIVQIDPNAPILHLQEALTIWGTEICTQKNYSKYENYQDKIEHQLIIRELGEAQNLLNLMEWH